jgi:hypothetical protein
MSKFTKDMFLSTIISMTLFPLFSLGANATDKTPPGLPGDSILSSGQPSPTFPDSSSDKAYTLSGSTLEKPNPLSILSTSVTIKPYAKKFQGKIAAIIAPGTSKAEIEKTVDHLVNNATVSIPLTLEQKKQLKKELVQAIQDGLIAQSVQKVPIVVNHHAEGSHVGQSGVNINWSNEIYILIQ